VRCAGSWARSSTIRKKSLEGQTLEDYPLPIKNARAMKESSEDAQWRVSPDVNYSRVSEDFKGLADELARKAGDGKLDGASLTNLKLTPLNASNATSSSVTRCG
jgi:hypothetical protein